jgi:hypothetical protein
MIPATASQNFEKRPAGMKCQLDKKNLVGKVVKMLRLLQENNCRKWLYRLNA